MKVECDSIHDTFALLGNKEVKSVQLGLVAFTLVDLKNFLSLLATYKMFELALEFSKTAMFDEFEPATLFDILDQETLVLELA